MDNTLFKIVKLADRFNLIYYNKITNKGNALIAQRIEQSRPKGKMRVQFFLGARKRARAVEWAALEMRYTGNSIGGSNPPASAKIFTI